MAIITRVMAKFGDHVLRGNLPTAGYPTVRCASFDEQPCTLAEANAHLELLAPHGIVVMSGRERGPLGGWINLRYTHDQISPNLAARRYLHIAYISKEDIHG